MLGWSQTKEAPPAADRARAGQSPSAAIPWALAAATFLIHCLASGGYGYFRDELYYLACAGHLDMGYVDHPPLSILLLALARPILGTSLFALRLLPAVAGAVTVFLIARLAARLGGGRFATSLAGLAAMAAPVYLAIDNYYSMNCFDLLLWTVAFSVLVRLIERATLPLWCLLGVVLGLGLMNKVSVLWLGAGLVAGMLLTEKRRWLLTPGPWIAGVIAAFLFHPYVIWQLNHDWATLEFMRNATQHKMAAVSVTSFLGDQFRVMNPIAAPIWIAGLVWLFFARAGRPWRLFGWIYLSVLAILLSGGSSRASYLSLAYPIVLAAGGVALEGLLARPAGRWLRPAALALVAAGGALLAPFALPILPIDRFVAYSRALGVKPGTEEKKEMGRLPQQYADMLGWPELAADVAKVRDNLPQDERATCAIYANNYGEAGAIDFFGPRHGLPHAMSGHNNYWLWGPTTKTGDCVIIIGGNKEDHERSFEQVEAAGVHKCQDCMPYESNLTLFVCRRLKVPVADAWPRAKNFS